MKQGVIDGYKDDACKLIQSFEAISSSDVLSPILEFIPESKCKIIEIGAGTGRDAAWLAARGHSILAVEPVAQFREAGRSLHSITQIEWVNDSLPSLSSIMQKNERYELALLISVWQHVPKEEKLESLINLRRCLKEGGKLIISVRNGPGSIKIKCYPTSVSETVALARKSDLKLISSQNAGSVQPGNKRAQVTWTWLVFAAI